MPQEVLRFEQGNSAAEMNRAVRLHSLEIFVLLFRQFFLSFRTSSCTQACLTAVACRTRTKSVSVHYVVLLNPRNHYIVLVVALFECMQVVSV